MRLPGRIPVAPPSVKITCHAPVESCAKSTVRQRALSQFVSAEWADSAESLNLMKHIPNTVQEVANDEHNRQPKTESAKQGEHNDRSGFKSPGSLISEIGGERQIKCRDCDEKQSKKDLLCFCREQFLRNENGSCCCQNSHAHIQGDDY